MRTHPAPTLLICLLIAWSFLTQARSADDSSAEVTSVVQAIQEDQDLVRVHQMARDLLRSGFNAGSGYGEVWIRDFATFIELSSDVVPHSQIRWNLLMFFRFQGDDGNIIDGFIPADKANVDYEYIKRKSIPDYVAHKNTVETDQESSLIQAVYRYVRTTGDRQFLQETVDGKSVSARMELALEFLLQHRFAQDYGLLWGATTVDWGDVQPEHPWGVVLDESSHPAIDIYDNAMFALALDNFLELLTEDTPPTTRARWTKVRDELHRNIRKHLWDKQQQKYIPHLYLAKGSPFPADFNENEILYFGGTAVAIQAGLLSPTEIRAVLRQMRDKVKVAQAPSLGLTVYPPYPEGYFQNPGMKPYSYQNGGDWTWFGGRMIQALVQSGMVPEAYAELQPMIQRVIKNNGFYEWYRIDGTPAGSATFRGSAGVLGKAIEMLQESARTSSAESK